MDGKNHIGEVINCMETFENRLSCMLNIIYFGLSIKKNISVHLKRMKVVTLLSLSYVLVVIFPSREWNLAWGIFFTLTKPECKYALRFR